MNAILFEWLWVLGRTTLLVALSALVVAMVLRLVRPKAPQVHRAAWCMVLLVGWLFAQMPVEVPWYEPIISQNVAQPPSAVEEDVAQPPSAVKDMPHDLQQPGAVVLHEAQQPRAVVLHEAQQPGPVLHDAQQPGAVVLHEAQQPGAVVLHSEPAPIDSSDVPAPIVEQSEPLVAVLPPVIDDRPSVAPTRPSAAASRPSPARDIFSHIAWQTILFALWLAGMVVVVLRWLAGYVRSLRAMSTALRPDEASCRQWRELLAGQGVEREIPLRLTEGMGPLLCRWPDGYELVVPAELWGSLGESARLGIMRHELAHYQRGDVWKSLVVRLLALPHWFNPAAWLAARRFEEAAEWACDEAAVAGHAPQTEYARTLLALAEASLGGGSCHPSMSRWNLSARVRRLLADSNAKDSIMKKLILTGLAAVLVAFCLVRIDLVAKPNTDVAQPPSAVAETPNDAQRPGAVVLQDAHDSQQPGAVVLHDAHDSQQPGAVVLHDAHDVQQPPSAVAEVGDADPKPGDTVRPPDAKESTNPTRRTLRYEGKTFDEWTQLVAKGVDQKQAVSLVATFTAFGSRGYGREASEQILLLIRQHGPDPNRPEQSPPGGMGGPMGPGGMMGGMGLGGPVAESPESQLSKKLIDRARTAFTDGFGPGYGVIPRKESLPALYRELREGNAKSRAFVLALFESIGERSPAVVAAMAEFVLNEINPEQQAKAFRRLVAVDATGDTTAKVLTELIEKRRKFPSLPASPFVEITADSTGTSRPQIMPGYRGVLRVVERCLDGEEPAIREGAMRHFAEFLDIYYWHGGFATEVSGEIVELASPLMNRFILAYAKLDLKVRPEIVSRLRSSSDGIGFALPASDQIHSLIESAMKSEDKELRRAADELLRDLGSRPEPGPGMGMGGMRGGGMGGPAGGMGPGVGGGMPGMGPATEPPPSVEEKLKKPAVSRDRLRLQGKSFDQWKDSLRTELSHAHRTEAIKAMTVFAANGYAKETTETILELAREHGNAVIDAKGQPTMISEAVLAFGPISTPEYRHPIPAKAAVPILVKELREGNEKSRIFVLTVLARLGSEGRDAVPALVDFIEIQEHKELRPMALAALMKTDPPADTFIKVLSKVIDAAPDRRTAQIYLAVIQADEIRFARDSRGRTRRPLAFSPQDTRFLTLLSSHAADPKSPIRRDAITMLACSMYFTLECLSDGDLPRIVGMIKKGGTVTEKDARFVDSLFGEVEQSAHEWLRRLAISYAELDDRKLPASNYMQQLANNVFFVLWTRSVSEGDDQELRRAVSDLLELKEMTAIEALQKRLLSSATASSLSTPTVPTVPRPTTEAESPYKSPGKAYYIVTHHNQGGRVLRVPWTDKTTVADAIKLIKGDPKSYGPWPSDASIIIARPDADDNAGGQQLIPVDCDAIASYDKTATANYRLLPGDRLLVLSSNERESLMVKTVTPPREGAMTTLPTYRIEPPDIIEIKIETEDKNAGTGLSAEGLFLVGPDGTVNLRNHGSVRMAGSTITEAASILEKHLSQFIESPKVSVRVSAVNSKVYYVITAGDKGDNVVRVPITGSETVLDGLAQIQGIVSVPLWSQKIWISRPAAGPDRKEETLPVDLKAIITGNTSTNYQIMPGDRLFLGPKEGGDKAVLVE